MSKPDSSQFIGSDFPVIGASPSNALSIALTAVFGTLIAFGANPAAEARDILRGGNAGSSAPQGAPRGNVNVPPSIQARAQAQNRLARTTQAVQAVQAMQKAARAAAIAGQNRPIWNPNKPGQRLPNVQNGLGVGGLKVAPGVPADLKNPTAGENANLWQGAKLPKQTVANGETTVTIKQTAPTAVLNWETFNVGAQTTLRYDQSAGKSNASKWIAFNKVNDPSGRPSQILGAIEAPGQVYVINTNGIIFGGSSQINTRGLVASSLPINDNLIRQGLLNNRDAQFLFSALPVAGGSDGTPAFYPVILDRPFTVGSDSPTYTLAQTVALSTGENPAPLKAPEFTYKAADGNRAKLVAGTDYTLAVDAASKKVTVTFTAVGLTKVNGTPVNVAYTPVAVKTGDVVVQPGAVLGSPVSGDGNGGRVMLVGSNVTNGGTISTPSGQTILAAGNQVAVAPHASADPSLRGLDVWVGAVGENAGKVTNTGMIETLTGSTSLIGRHIKQLGAIESSTSVNLNGRIDIRASYGAVANPNFDNTAGGAGGPPFLFQNTGTVIFGKGSVTRILPDYTSERTVPGTSLPQNSQVNVEGHAIHFRSDAMLQAPSGDVTIRAGVWPYKDTDGNRTTFDAAGQPEVGLQNYYSGANQKFLFSGGQIYFDPTALLDVAGSTDVFVPLAHSILNVEFRGSELADSPLQREGLLRAIPLTLDIRRTGVQNGRFWMGTPLGDATGLAGLVERNAAQLTATGGNVNLQAGGSIVIREGATIDVSGGYFRHEAGMVKTTRLLQDGRLVDIANALPGQTYDGVFTGKSTEGSAKWGVSKTYTAPFMTGERFEPEYIQGAAGGQLSLTAPSMAIDGELLGQTVRGPRERGLPAAHSSLSISFAAERTFQVTPTDLRFLPVSPTPPKVIFSNSATQTALEPFHLVGDVPGALPADRISSVFLSPALLAEQGFGHLSVENPDGDIILPGNVALTAPAQGSISLAGANVTIRGDVSAPGGSLKFTTYNISPSVAAELALTNPGGTLAAAPSANPDRGLFTLGPAATLNTAGLVIDDRNGSSTRLTQPLVLGGGSISIESYSANLSQGSTIDVSGGVAVSARGQVSYGNGGSISIRTGRDLSIGAVLGGELSLGSTLLGYSSATGGSLRLLAGAIQIGGFTSPAGTLHLQPDFFRQGGFTSYAVEGIGAPSGETPEAGELATYLPGISIAPGTVIRPVAESLLATPYLDSSDELHLQRILNPVGQRSPVSVSFSALGADDRFTVETLEVRGDLVMGRGARIITDPGANVSFRGDTVTLLGAVTAPGGSISITGADKFPLRGTEATNAAFARATVYIGSQAMLSTAGTTVLRPDAYGRRTGTLLSGGTISVSGNIVARAGATLDVSGSSTVFDLHPTQLGLAGSPLVSFDSGLLSQPWKLRSVSTQVDSSGGVIELNGSEMLLSDATLLGRAGGPTATGGTLSVFSGRFYSEGASRTSADINLTVTQSGNTIASANSKLGVGLPVLDRSGTPITGAGYFAADHFSGGQFHSLDLGAKYLETGNPLPFGGNVEFRGPVSIDAPGLLRVAGGGVIQANAPVTLSGSYVAIGQPFRAPLHPDDPVLLFQQSAAGSQSAYNFAPTAGPGFLTITAGVIDTGTLSLQNIGKAALIADGGDIRGNGTLNIAGNLYLRAGQIYPTTASDFTIAAFDRSVLVASSSSGSTEVKLASAVLPHGFRVGSALLGSRVKSITGDAVVLESGANTTIASNTPITYATGSVTIASSGNPDAPLSAGGNLNIFASRIVQGGTLRAPLGAITIGWDGTDFDPSDSDFDRPVNPITGSVLFIPTAQKVTLTSGSLTSVAAVSSGQEMLIPFGLSPDGLSWIDPRGVNVTVGGLPQKTVSVAGNKVTSQSGSTVEISGGGDLYSFRWVPGIGGSSDILGTASGAWGAGTEYQPGDLVSFGGKTWTARVRHTGERPSASAYWSLVPESYAVLPGYTSHVAPYAPFNTGENSASLGGDPGYVSSALRVGDSIYLDASPGLASGVYTLLPRRYALLPGAFLVTPTAAAPIGTFTLPDSASFVSGYNVNMLGRAEEQATIRTRFEVASSDVVRTRAQYDDIFADSFMREAAMRFDIQNPQRLPSDAGYAGFHGNTALRTQGSVLTDRAIGGRGAAIDLSSFGDIYVVGGRGSAPAGATTVLNTQILNSWGAESLLIGGLRREGASGTQVDVRTSKLVLDNPGSALAGPEVTLGSRAELTLTAGSSVASTGLLSSPARNFLLSGDGTLLRVSGDVNANIIRSGVTGSTAPLMNIGAGVSIAGSSIILDSTYGTYLDPTTNLRAQALTLGSGQISIVLNEANAPLAGAVVDPQLTISGQFLRDVQQVASLRLSSYRTIDFYGSGNFGSGPDGKLTLSAAGIRGFEQEGGTVVLDASTVLFTNPSKVTALAAPETASGTFQVNAGRLIIGENTFSVAGYDQVVLNASGGVSGKGSGAFTTPGDMTINTPVISGTRGSTHAITAGGALALERSGGTATVTSGLGSSFTFTGAEVLANTTILLPSGQITLRATNGDVTVGGNLDVAGKTQNFYDLIRYSNGGNITLISETGDVELLTDSRVSVAAPAEGGNAGTIAVKASQGTFASNGATLLGTATNGSATGSFVLDVGTLPSLAEVSTALTKGGFFEQRNFRVRTGDVLIGDVDGQAHVARNFTVSADQGDIRVTGTIDASGQTGGTISLIAGGSLILESGAELTVHGKVFSSADKGGDIRLEAGAAFDGVPNLAAALDIQSGSTIDLGVDAFVAGDYTTPGSSAFYGQFTGKLHLRAPRNGNDVNINAIQGNIIGASSVLAEAYRIYDRTGTGTLDNTLRSQIHADSTAFINAGYNAIWTNLLNGNPDAAGLADSLVIAPGIEIINRTGDLTLGTAANNAANDWNLAPFRYGPRSAPGVLTLRAAGNLVFLNALSDGFSGGFPVGTPVGQQLWLSRLMAVNENLPVNTQSWSYRLAAGADFASADFQGVRPIGVLPADSGSLFLGKFYDANLVSGPNATTANAINNRYQVIRTGTGDIQIAAARDVQLRNQFASIYTAGVRLANPSTIFEPGDFSVPIVERAASQHPGQGNLGGIQQVYPAQWSMAGGQLTISAQGDIGRFTMFGGEIIADSSRQLPNNWLYRRGYVDAATGLFGVGGVDAPPFATVTDPSASTTWWVDFSNFFQGFGALGGGDITLVAGRDVVNADAVIPTNARMPGRDSTAGINLAPEPDRLVELGGGDLVVRAGNNIDGGMYYVERGSGTLSAGGSITTNAARSPSLGLLGSTEQPASIVQSTTPAVYDPQTWLPTTLFLGKSQFDVSARGDVLLGPTANTFLLPQGLNNKFWYKTYFNTFSPDAGVTVASFGGDVTHRLAVTLPGSASAQPILDAWLSRQNLFTGAASAGNASFYQPWIRLAELDLSSFGTVFTVGAPTLRSTAFAGDVNIVGPLTLFPSPTGTLELAASGGIVGLQPSGRTRVLNRDVTVWTAATINLSDADPALMPGIGSPLAYTSFVGRSLIASQSSTQDFYAAVSQLFEETGSYTGAAATIEVQQALHASGLLHANDRDPVQIYATGGDITGLTLFSPKATRVIASNDITDIAVYIQNVASGDISLVSAGRDIVPYNENAPVRSLAGDLLRGNLIGDATRATVTNTQTSVLQGDIQISGPGIIEVLAGRNLDLGTGPNFTDGTGVGVTSIGNARNPFLPADGADIVAFAGVAGPGGNGPALGLSESSLDFAGFIRDYLPEGAAIQSAYLDKLTPAAKFEDLDAEKQAIVALETFYSTLRESGRGGASNGDYSAGIVAAELLFGSGKPEGEIFTRARDIRTTSGGSISLAAPGGGLTLASDVFGNPLTPPGIVTEFGGSVSVFTDGSVDIGQARIFTLRGGDIVMWSASGDIAAGTAAKTVVTAPPTRVLIDATSAAVQTDLGGLATGGGIGVLASVEGVQAGDVDLIAPSGTIDAGDAGIRVTGNLNIAAVSVLNAGNIQVGGATSGASASAPVAAPSVGNVSGAASSAAASTTAATQVAPTRKDKEDEDEDPSIILVEVVGYGGGEE